MDPLLGDSFRRDLSLAQQDVRAGVVSSRAKAALGHWALWRNFCANHGLDPTLQEYSDPVPFLQVFMRRYRVGTIAPKGRQVRSRTVEDAIRSVGQTFSSVGSADPRLTAQGNMDFRIQRQLACYSKQDPPPNRVKPIPVPILMNIMATAVASADAVNVAIANMIALAFFYLFRPGEYTGTRSDTTPFRLCDIQLFVGPTRLDLFTAPEATLWTATFATYEFTDQKNGVRGEVVGLGRSGNPQFCPVLCTIRQVLYLRSLQAPRETPLASYWKDTKIVPISPKDITEVLRVAVTALGPLYGFLPKDISARSLRASGAMALLCAQVDTDVIRLIGRWRSDEMLRYLHVQAEPVMRDFSSRMINHGAFTLLPNHEVPVY